MQLIVAAQAAVQGGNGGPGSLLSQHGVSFPTALPRYSAGTNLHELTGDFYTVSQILGHSTKSVTARYVDVRLDRKLEVLTVYHNAVLPKADPPRPAPTTVVVGRMPGTSK